jgi:hypothetical protein
MLAIPAAVVCAPTPIAMLLAPAAVVTLPFKAFSPPIAID